jgi:beta-lysine 5,6-aminomutase alpha subunit
MRSKLGLDAGLVASCREVAAEIARCCKAHRRSHHGVSGAHGRSPDGFDVPLANVLIDRVHEQRGLACWLGNAIIATGPEPLEIAKLAGAREVDLCGLRRSDDDLIGRIFRQRASAALEKVRASRADRAAFCASLGRDDDRPGRRPELWVLTTTGNV